MRATHGYRDMVRKSGTDGGYCLNQQADSGFPGAKVMRSQSNVSYAQGRCYLLSIRPYPLTYFDFA